MLEEGRVAVNQLYGGAGQRRKRWGWCRVLQRKSLAWGEGRIAVDQL